MGFRLFPNEEKMDLLPRDISMLSFKRTNLEYQNSISLDGKMLRLLLAMDGEKSAAQIAIESGLDTTILRSALQRLLELKLVTLTGQGPIYLDTGFLEGLRINLAQSLGPMAEFLVEDVVTGMGLSMSEVPIQRAAELISALAEELPDEDTGVRFKKAMINLIPKQTVPTDEESPQ